MKKDLTLLFLLFSLSLWGQQLSQISNSGAFQKAYNPAQVSEEFLLFENTITVDVDYLSQWVDIKGNPTTQNLYIQYLYETEGAFNLLFGGRISNDETGPTGQIGGYGSIAALYAPEDPYYGGMSIGFSLGAVQYRVNTGEFNPRHANDILTFDNRKSTRPDIGLGFSYYKKDRNGWLNDGYWWAGLSAQQILSNDATFDNVRGELELNKVPHTLLFGGFQKYFADAAMVQPSILVRYIPNAPVNLDVNFRYFNKEAFWVGIGGSSSRTMFLEAGVVLGDNIGFDGRNVRVGYQFGYSLKDYGASIGNIHQFQLNYSFEAKLVRR